MFNKREISALTDLRKWLFQMPKLQAIFLIVFSSFIVTYVFVPEFLKITAVPFISIIIPLIIVLVVAEIFLLIIAQKLCGVGFYNERSPGKNTFSWRIFLNNTYVVFSVMILYCASFGFMGSPDTAYQWNQVQTFTFNDWHPVAHTFLIWVASRLVNSYTAIVFMQLYVLSLACGYLAATLAYWNFPRWCRNVCTLYFCVNPAVGIIMLRLWKDNAFSIFALLLLSEMINIYFSKGSFLKKPIHFIFTVIFMLGVSMMRHNGVLFTLPLLLLLLVIYRKYWKRVSALILAVVCMFIGIKTIGFRLLNVQKYTDPYGESVGMFMAMMSEAYVNDRSSLPDDVREYMSSIASEEDWSKYVCGDWNSVKFLHNNGDNVSTIPIMDFADKFFRTLKACPTDCRKAFMELTKVVWDLGGDNPRWCTDYSTDIGLSVSVNNIATVISDVSKMTPFSWAFWYVGAFMLFMMLACLLTFRRNGFKSLIFIIPALTYNFITMLLLSSNNDQRFFSYNTFIFLPICMVLLFKGERKEANQA